MLLAIQYPSWLHPEIIPGLPFLRWYGLMYLVAFGIAYFLFSYQVKHGEFERYSGSQKAMTQDDISDLFIWGILGLILGARIFGTLVYNPETYLKAPWLIFWPFARDGAGNLPLRAFKVCPIMEAL